MKQIKMNVVGRTWGRQFFWGWGGILYSFSIVFKNSFLSVDSIVKENK